MEEVQITKKAWPWKSKKEKQFIIQSRRKQERIDNQNFEDFMVNVYNKLCNRKPKIKAK